MNAALESTPRADGFRMPGEHEPQQAVLMAWPERGDNWRNNAGPAQRAFTAVAAAIAEATPVTMHASASQLELARSVLPANVAVVELPCNDSWMRDIGPSFVVNEAGEIRGVDWAFNAWGGAVNGLYDDWADDDALASRVLSLRNEGRYRAPLILEGGAIHVDGEGTCITTAECLLHPGRNPGLDQSQIEGLLCDYLNVDKVIWLPRGLYNDETDGHVDNILHVVKPAEVVLTWCDDPADPVYDICRQCLATLETEKDARGREFTVHKLPMPGPLYISEEEAAGVTPSAGMERAAGERLAASYANFLITNQRVVFPLLDPAHDDQVKGKLTSLFPGREIVGVPGREIVLGGGNIHCITQQIPATGEN
ncbi:agmatine deiminase [Seongchinamella unica]|uniref:Putative agmatine deiminase n=1 Tax=Seongchinamella unica TaxID=2547392 RepID=A0A4V2ZXN9_9GAMM|nr:agmatine deiminase [Seongchinamella unica]TDG15735.1 agmatine deiminase [Seongchinamella unica]